MTVLRMLLVIAVILAMQYSDYYDASGDGDADDNLVMLMMLIMMAI